MKPTAVATETAWPSAHTSQKPPISANGTVSISRAASPTRRKAKYSSRKITSRVSGTTVRSLASARSRYSNWPDQPMA